MLHEPNSSPEPRRGYTRHDARELALQILFQCDFHESTEFWLEQFWAQREASESVRTFVSQLVTGVRTHQVELDGLITSYARNWTVDRMPVVDRNILRQAMYELLWIPDVPAKVTVDEALELAKIFADDETRRFVNGVLDQLIKHDARLEPKRSDLAH
jgi:N utilization substance protein B